LRKDRNLAEIIESREKEVGNSFWEDLIGPRHTANLSPYFIEGMFGKSLKVSEAAKELRLTVKSKLSH